MRISLYRLKKKGMQAAIVAAGAMLLTFAAPLAGTNTDTFAVTKEEAEQQKEEAEQGQEDAKALISQYKTEMDALVETVKELDEQSTNLSGQIIEQQQKADDLQTEIEETKKNLAEAQVSEDNQYAAMKKRIQYLYEEGDVEYIDALLSSASFEDSLNKSEYVEQIGSYDQKQLNNLMKTKKDIADYEQKLESDLAEVKEVKANLETNQADLDSVISQKNTEISNYSTNIEKQEALEAYYAQLEEEADNDLAEIARQEAEKKRAEAAAAAAAAAAANQSSSGSSDSTTTSGGSSVGTGQFIWPVSTGGTVTSEYGARSAPTAGASTYHRGLDIGCGYGDAILAADSGTVVFAGYGNSGGNYVMIDHGNGYTTMYLHNSSLAVSAGQTVSQGQVIAYAGSTGVSTGTHCHFSVLVNGSYVNPRDYL